MARNTRKNSHAGTTSNKRHHNSRQRKTSSRKQAMRTRNKKIIRKLNIIPNKSAGQNFLTSQRVISKEINALNMSRSDTILEIGPGTGNLTKALCSVTNHVILIEKDKRFKRSLFEIAKNSANTCRIKVIWGDATDPETLQQIRFTRVIGNLPYNLTLPIIFTLLETQTFHTGVFIIQKELAERLTARPGQSGYGRISVYVQSFANIKVLETVKPGAFNPQPAVDSSMMILKPHTQEFIQPLKQQHQHYAEFLKQCFVNRTHTLPYFTRPAYKANWKEFVEVFLDSV
ncbi:MAG: 16S rRNA (adenine(1518)-N(6)/adenine(1519)-N(6))-dimethyltransferase RsmA [Candidatus Dojkabacteria bacterium]